MAETLKSCEVCHGSQRKTGHCVAGDKQYIISTVCPECVPRRPCYPGAVNTTPDAIVQRFETIAKDTGLGPVEWIFDDDSSPTFSRKFHYNMAIIAGNDSETLDLLTYKNNPPCDSWDKLLCIILLELKQELEKQQESSDPSVQTDFGLVALIHKVENENCYVVYYSPHYEKFE